MIPFRIFKNRIENEIINEINEIFYPSEQNQDGQTIMKSFNQEIAMLDIENEETLDITHENSLLKQKFTFMYRLTNSFFFQFCNKNTIKIQMKNIQIFLTFLVGVESIIFVPLFLVWDQNHYITPLVIFEVLISTALLLFFSKKLRKYIKILKKIEGKKHIPRNKKK